MYCKSCWQGGLTQPNTSGIVPESFSIPPGPWGNLFYYFSSPEQFKNSMLIWFIMWEPGKTVNGVSWGEEDNVFQGPWLICSDLVQTGLCNLWAPIVDFTKASLSCQQYRGKRGAEGEPVEREHTMLFPNDRLSQLREKPLCSGSSLLCGWHTCHGWHTCVTCSTWQGTQMQAK